MLQIKRVDPLKYSDVLKRLQQECLPVDELYDVRNGYWWIAYYKHIPVGFAGLSVVKSWPGAGYLCRSGVIHVFRGKGLQKRLIRVRARFAKELGLEYLISDTHLNPASANSLIACGFKTYNPESPWAFDDSIYWMRKL